MAQFYGSAPDNERVELYYDTKDNERPVSVAYCAQSLIGDKPTYSIYYLDGYYNNTTWVSCTEFIEMSSIIILN